MSQEAVERLLGRLITDERFRRLAAESLGSACLQEGYCLSQAELRLLSGLELQGVTELAGRLDPGLCRAGPGGCLTKKRLLVNGIGASLSDNQDLTLTKKRATQC